MKNSSDTPLRKSVRKLHVCIPIYFDEGIYLNAGAHAGQRNVYWRSIVVLCASMRRSSVSDLEIVVCSNELPSSDISSRLDELGVSFISPDFSFRAPEGMAPLFSGAFYLFDCMTYCCRNLSDDGIFVFVDPDCLMMKDFGVIREYCEQWPLIGYEMDFNEDQSENGCSRRDLLAFLNTMEDSRREPPKYFGGEFFVATAEALPGICAMIERVWKINNRNFQSGNISLKTEEHVLTVALALSPEPIGTGNTTIIKRMWTRPSFRNVTSSDRALLIWHLPAEKRYGLQRLFNLLERDTRNLMGLNDKEFEDLAAEFIHLEPSSVEKACYFLYPKLKFLLRRSGARG